MKEQFMNEPILWDWTEDDLIAEFVECQDKRKVSKIYCISLREVTAILKKKGIAC